MKKIGDPFRVIIQIMRHGEAEPKSSSKKDDDRSLTSKGKTQVRAVLRMAEQLSGSRIDIILSSPVTRAKETAEITKEIYEIGSFAIDGSLEPSRMPYEVIQRISGFDPNSTILLVTHQPLVSTLASSLLNWDGEYFAMPPGAIARVDVAEGFSSHNPKGKLVYLLPPPSDVS